MLPHIIKIMFIKCGIMYFLNQNLYIKNIECFKFKEA